LVALDVEFHGVETYPRDGSTHAGSSATTTVNRDDFGVDFNMPPGMDRFSLGRKIAVELELQFVARIASSVSAYPPLLTAIGQAVRDDEYPPDLGPLSVQAALMGDLVDHRRSLGVDTVRMREVKELMDQRVADGHGDQGFSSLFALLGNRH